MSPHSLWTTGGIATHRFDLQLKNPSSNITEVWSFMGSFDVFQRIVPNVVRITALLNRKLRKDQQVHFEEIAKDKFSALQKMQKNLSTPPALSLSWSKGTFTLDINACRRQVGCILLQCQGRRPGKPIGFWSWSLKREECACETTHKERFGAVWAVLILRPYLKGALFKI